MTLFNKQYTQCTAFADDRGNRLTYGEVQHLAEEVSAHLLPESLVFCLCKNEIGSVLGYISFIEHGSVPVMLDASKDSGLIGKLLEIYKPNYIWLPATQWKPAWGKELFRVYNYVLTEYSVAKVNLSKKLGLLLTTSGSTGSPKLVRLSLDNLISNAESIVKYLHIDSNEKPVTSMPMYYSYGLSVINSHLIRGATILLTDFSVIQKEFWDFVRENKATSIAGVPYTYEMLRRLKFFGMDLPFLKTMTQAGGKLNAGLVKEYGEGAKNSGKKFIVMYGQTEATARMSYLPFEDADRKADSIGIAIPGGKFRLMDSDNNEIIESDVEGELIYEGPNVSLGYAENQADLSKPDENNGVLYTGDLAKRDDDGFYYITGRKKRFVKVFGNRVNLDTVEQLVKEKVTSCACIGVDDRITIFITDKDCTEQIRPFLTRKTGLHASAFSIKLIDKIPVSSSGKIQYPELCKLI